MKKKKLSKLAKEASKMKIRVNKELGNKEDNGPYMQKKMEEAKRILSIAGVPE